MTIGSTEAFIAEHYWGYSKYNAVTTFEYPVAHPPWNIHKVKSFKVDCEFVKLYGKDFVFMHEIEPASVFVAQGSPIKVTSNRIIKN